MKRITAFKNITEINKSEKIPDSYISFLDFQWNVIRKGNSIRPFKRRNKDRVQLFHLDKQTDVSHVMDHLMVIQTIEYIESVGETFFRIGIEKGNQLIILCFLSGTLPEELEAWLKS